MIKLIFDGMMSLLLLLVLEILIIVILFVQRVLIDWLFEVDYIKVLHIWLNKIKKENL